MSKSGNLTKPLTQTKQDQVGSCASTRARNSMMTTSDKILFFLLNGTVVLGETLSKQEKLLGFDNSEATLTRDLLNQILSERATVIKVTEDVYNLTDNEVIGPPLPDFLRPKDENASNTISLQEDNASKIQDTNEIIEEKPKEKGFFDNLKKSLSFGNDSEKKSPE